METAQTWERMCMCQRLNILILTPKNYMGRKEKTFKRKTGVKADSDALLEHPFFVSKKGKKKYIIKW